MKTAAIIAAAGSGSRMGGDKNKLLLEICGKTVIDRTLEVFSSCETIDAIILVTGCAEIKKIAEKYLRVIKIAGGGKTRAESVLNGITAAEGFDFVAVHDGARPLVTKEIIEKTVKEAMKTGAAATGTGAFDTIKITDENGIIVKTSPREDLKCVQTPQVFKRELLLSAYKTCAKEGTDDSFILECAGFPVKVVEGSRENIKITTALDILFAEAILKARDGA